MPRPSTKRGGPKGGPKKGAGPRGVSVGDGSNGRGTKKGEKYKGPSTKAILTMFHNATKDISGICDVAFDLLI